jgi:hypothetical protein
MAITLDQTTLGTVNSGGDSGTVTLTTTATVSSNAFIVVGVMPYEGTTTLSSVSGGGLTWSVDKTEIAGISAIGLGIASAQAPAGLASGTNITFTFSDALGGPRWAGGMSLLGVKTSSPLDGTPPAAVRGTTAAWATNSQTIQAGSCAVALQFAENTATANTPTAPALQAWELLVGGGPSGMRMDYDVRSSTGSANIAGTMGGASVNGSILVAYLAAPAAGTPVLVPRHALGGGRW